MTMVCCNVIEPDSHGLSDQTKYTLSETKIVKKRLAIINFAAIVAALYLYDRHNRLCEPGIYSMFSFLEYIVIVANIVYHFQAYSDLGGYSITVGKSSSHLKNALIKDNLSHKQKHKLN